MNHSTRLWVLVVLMLACLVFSSAAAAQEPPSGFEPVAENEFLVLYLNEDSVELAVLDKASGYIWYTNPPERARKETVARGANKDRLNAQIVITYNSTNQQNLMDSYNDSVKYGQYQVVPIENGVRIDYELGQAWQLTDYLPTVISVERFNELLTLIPNEKDRQFLRGLYAEFSLEEGYDPGEDYSIHGVDMEALLGEYGLKVEEPRFRTSDKRRLLQEYLVLIRDTNHYDGLGDVEAEDIEPLYGRPTLMLKWNNMQWDIDAAAELLRDVGYTPEQVVIDHEMYKINPPFPDLRRFQVSVEYYLDGENFVVRIPTERVVFPERVYDPKLDREVSYPLTAIQVLPYFGAADVDAEGYLLVPGGSGALIYLNNGKTQALPYNRPVYGPDFAVGPQSEYSPHLKEQIYLPVFGLKQGEHAFFAIVEEGDALTRIEAAVSGMRDSFNRVWSSFDVRPNARVSLDAEGELIHLRRLFIYMYQARTAQTDFTVRYSFLNGDEASYAGMAQLYQDYLVSRFGLRPLENRGFPLVLDIVGSYDVVKPVYGIPKNVVEPFTTYSQAEAIIDDLYEQGIDVLEVRYLGWLAGGINHKLPTGVRLERVVGSKDDLQNLAGHLSTLGGRLYPSFDLGLVHRNGFFDRFVAFLDASRFLNRQSAYLNVHNIATYQSITEQRRPLVSPAKYDSIVDRFLADYTKLGVAGIALGDLGKLLYSDFRTDPDRVVDRQAARDVVVQQLEKFSAAGLDLMLEGSNAYLLPYSDVVVMAPSYSRGFELIDVSVPFYQMVVSGYVAYAGEPYNLADRSGRYYLLKMLENGSLPYFAVSWETSSVVKHTDFDHFYSTYYSDVSQDIITLYEEAAGVLRDIWHLPIVNHDVLGPDVFVTEYADGTKIYVNYTAEAVFADGVLIPGEDYVVIK